MIYVFNQWHVETEGDDYYVAPSAQVIGAVRLGAGASVWFNSVLRGDSDWLNIGSGSNVQDGSVIHTDEGVPVHIGANVTVGHAVLLHGCTIENDSLVGNRAIVLDRARVGRHCMVAAGALIPPGKEIPDGSVVMGIPGVIVRQVTASEVATIANVAKHYRERAQQYRHALVRDKRGVA